MFSRLPISACGLVFVALSAILIPSVRPQSPQGEPMPGAVPGAVVRRAGMLVLHRLVERELGPGQTDVFTVTVAAGQFAHVVAEQEGVEVRVRIVAPHGKVLVTAARANGAWGPDAVSWIAMDSGVYEVRVFQSKPPSDTGHYQVELTDLREPVESDRSRIEAESRFFSAETELETGDKEKQTEAIEGFGRAAAQWRELKDRYEEAYSLDLIGKAYWGLDDPQKALEFYRQAQPLFQALGDRDGEGLTLMCIGNDYWRLGEERQALEYYEEAQPFYRSVGDRASEANTLTNIGMVYSDIGEDQEALKNLRQALLLDHAVGNRRGEAATLGNIGSLYFDLGEMQKALESFTRSLPLFRALDDRLDEDRTLINIGASYWELGETRIALHYYEQALPLERALGDRDSEEKTLSNMGDLYARMGDDRNALDHHSQALLLERASENRRDEANTLESLGKDYSDMGENQKALDSYNQALRLARAVSDLSMQGLLLSNLMQYWRGENRPGLAIFFGKEAVNQYQDLRRNIADLDPQLQRSYLATVTKTYRGLADLLIAQGRLAEAEQILSLLKEQEYFDYVLRDAAEGAVEGHANLNPDEVELDGHYRAVADKLAAAANECVALLARKTRTPEETSRLDQLEKELTADNEAFDRFFVYLAQHFSDRPAWTLHSEQMPETQGMMKELRELPAGTVAIYTLVGQDKFRSILCTPGAQKAYEYPIHAADLNRKVLAFRQAVTDPRIDPRPIAEELYKIMVGPMAEDLRQANAQTLMWSLDGVLRYLPLAALYDGKQYLIEHYRMSVMTLASNTRLTDRPDTQWRAAGFGVTKSYQGLPPLPLVSDELASIIATRPGDPGVLPGEILLNDAFTKQTMRQALLEGYPVVHIASHFRFQPGNDTQSYLLLGDGSHLSLSELKGSVNLFGSVQLLTLSACDTGMGDGTEVEGFGALAERQGAKAVIASLWAVADSSTKILMQKFYRIRESSPGMTKLEALREAQLDLLGHSAKPAEATDLVRTQASPRVADTLSSAARRFPFNPRSPYAHPYYWAPFFLMGNWL